MEPMRVFEQSDGTLLNQNTNLSVASYPTPKKSKHRVSDRDGGGEREREREREARLLHSAQDSSPRERFIWTSSGGIDFKIEEPLASGPDLMTVGRNGWEGGGGGGGSRGRLGELTEMEGGQALYVRGIIIEIAHSTQVGFE
jgi:hypothetical protein